MHRTRDTTRDRKIKNRELKKKKQIVRDPMNSQTEIVTRNHLEKQGREKVKQRWGNRLRDRLKN